MSLFRKFFIWFSTPHGSSNIRKTNFVNVQIDAIAVGLANAASPFLPVFLTRLGASTIQVGLLTSMPAVAGLLFAIPFGSFLQRKSNIIPWFSGSRLGVIMGYALTGLVTFFVPPEARIIAVIFIWAILTIPQTILSIAFSVVMNSIAGPTGRFELMSRRWSILGLTTSLTVFLIGGVVSQGTFPLNYQLMFIALSVGGLISFLFSSRLEIAPSPPQEGQKKPNFLAYWQQVKGEKPFISFNVKRLVYMTGIYLATPLFPVYFVRDLHASEFHDRHNQHGPDRHHDGRLFPLDAAIQKKGNTPCLAGYHSGTFFLSSSDSFYPGYSTDPLFCCYCRNFSSGLGSGVF